jgi:SAM-dependent methyltransferase
VGNAQHKAIERARPNSGAAEIVDQLFIGHAANIMAAFPAGSVDLIVTSPPYWTAVEYDQGVNPWPSYQAYLEDMQSVWNQCARVLRPNGKLCINAPIMPIPKSVIEAAAIDGARFWTRFRTIVFPLLSPTTFFLLVVNIVYAFFETFGVIHTITSGGPQQATTILVYKVYSDGFVGQDLGSSAAQSVILLVVVSILTVIQFKYIERRVHY